MTGSTAPAIERPRRPVNPWLAILPALAAAAIYGLTLSYDVGPGDAAELALAAHRLGVTHPPGSPVHTLLGFLFTKCVNEPAVGTNLLSALATACATGILALVTLAFTRSSTVSILAPLTFACAPAVWESAVSTEVYNVGVAFFALALWTTLRWYVRPATRRASGAALPAALAVGTSASNILLLPGWAVLVWRRSRKRRRDLLAALTVGVAVGIAVLAWPALRSAASPPLGTHALPTARPGFIDYVTASQYRFLGAVHPAFYLWRILDHLSIFASSFLWIGLPIAALGIWRLYRTHRRIAIGITIMFVTIMAYFTWHPWIDYHEMVTAGYWISALALGMGIDHLQRIERRRGTAWRAIALLGLIVVALAATGMRDHLARDRRPVTPFVVSSFERFPADAAVSCAWDTLTPMLYHQEVHDARPDLLLFEHTAEKRHYPWGTVENWGRFLQETSRSRPVVVDGTSVHLAWDCETRPLGMGWFLFEDCSDAPVRRTPE